METNMPRDISKELSKFTGISPGQEVSCDFDFSSLKQHPMSIKLDVGASAYWSEIASMQTLDNLLIQGKIDIDDYLERVPDGYISRRQELLDKIKESREESKKIQTMGLMQQPMSPYDAGTAENKQAAGAAAAVPEMLAGI